MHEEADPCLAKQFSKFLLGLQKLAQQLCEPIKIIGQIKHLLYNGTTDVRAAKDIDLYLHCDINIH